MEYFNQIAPVIIGETGTLSRQLCNHFSVYKLSFKVIPVSRKDRITSKVKLYKLLDRYCYSINNTIVINTLAALRPKTLSDDYINQYLPLDLIKYFQNKNITLYHISSVNVNITDLMDKYTMQKRNSEDLLSSSPIGNITIIRLPLLLPISDFFEVNLSSQYKLLRFLLSIPYFPIVPPSRNIYKPLDLELASQKIVDLILENHNTSNISIYDFSGNEKMNLYQIASLFLSRNTNYKFIALLKIPFTWRLLDYLRIKFPFLNKLLKANPLLQQLLPIARY